MAEFQWWLLIAGLVAGGGLVAVVLMESSRNDWDVEEDERRAEARWISETIANRGELVTDDEVGAVLEAHREYLRLPPPDRLEPVAIIRARVPAGTPSADAHPDGQADHVGDDGGSSPDHDLTGP